MQYLAFGVLMNFSSRWWIFVSLILFWGGYSYWLGMDVPLMRLIILCVLLSAVDLAIRPDGSLATGFWLDLASSALEFTSSTSRY